MVTGRYIPDSKVPEIMEVDQGGGVKQLVIRYKDADQGHDPVIHVMPFMPKKQAAVKRKPKKKVSRWHDVWVYAITSVPMIATCLFARELLLMNAFHLFFAASFLWIWVVFLCNTKWRKVK